MSFALRFAAVSYTYHGQSTPALEKVSLSLQPGERVALLGRNGAGKSTLVRLITGLAHPTTGVVWVGDWETQGRRPEELARRVGSVFQHADQQLFARSVREDVEFGPRALGLDASESARRTDAALADLGLTAFAEQHPYDLPPPFRKLAALAGALALAPSVLVLDEPTAGLDRASRALVAAAIAARSRAGVAVLTVTHDLGFAAEALDRALVLDRGRLARDAPLHEFLTQPAVLAPLGLVVPPVAGLSLALDLPGRPITVAAATRALAARCRG